jgi:hypothetical protein
VKRFTDTNLWDKSWYMDLSPVEKCAIHYIKDKCDNVGVWSPNIKLAEIVIGASVDWGQLIEKCNGNIVILSNEKWWLIDFCDFQYGELNEDTNNKAHLSYIRMLKKHGLWQKNLDAYRGHICPLDTHKEKDKDNGKDKDNEENYNLKNDFEDWWEKYPRKDKKASAFKLYKHHREKYTKEDLIIARDSYIETISGKDPQFVRLPTTFLNKNGDWLTWLNKVHEKPILPPSPLCPICSRKLHPDGHCKDPDCGWRPE